MSAGGVVKDVERNDATMANTILSTKRGRYPRSSASSSKWGGEGDAPSVPGRKRSKTKGSLVGYDHCCGIHGAARERAGLKHSRVTARRRYEKELIKQEMESL